MSNQKRAFIDPQKCDNSPFCPAIRNCPAKAIEREEEGDVPFVNNMCQGCRICINICPQRAISMV